jgi:hypothetical protein
MRGWRDGSGGDAVLECSALKSKDGAGVELKGMGFLELGNGLYRRCKFMLSPSLHGCAYGDQVSGTVCPGRVRLGMKGSCCLIIS